MADGMKLHVITPEERFYDGEVSMVELTTTEGLSLIHISLQRYMFIVICFQDASRHMYSVC